jgi:two-component system chemotaxis response regulator CheB
MRRDIIVIGMSTGGFESIQELVKGFPKNFDASIFIVWHIPFESYGVLPDVLERVGPLPMKR